MSSQLQIVALAVAALALGGSGFVAGMTVGPTLAKTEAAAAANASPGAAGAAGAQGRRQAGGAAGVVGGIAGGGQGQQVTGRVISVNDGSITVETRQPGDDTARSLIALVGGNARVLRTTEVDIKLSDIRPGDQVLIVGAPDQATGTVTANAVIVGINALQQLFGGGAGPGGAPGAGGAGIPASEREPGHASGGEREPATLAVSGASTAGEGTTLKRVVAALDPAVQALAVFWRSAVS